MKDHQEIASKSYWNNRYLNQQIGWDIGNANLGLVNYVTSHVDKSASILIPGAGSGYEAKSLWDLGYENVTVLDWSEEAVSNLLKSNKDKQEFIIIGDFFEHQAQYDCIIEQTFFCALPPKLRKDYVAKTSSLLSPNGLLIGLLFNRRFNKPGPPFGGDKSEYQALFSSQFDLLEMEIADFSIKPRQGSELKICFRRQ